MIDRWRLHLFREVAIRGTVIAAADAAFVTPSAVSQQLASLERETGLALFERHGRRLQLTPDGAVLLEHADAIIAAFEAAESSIAAMSEDVAGTVRVGAFASAAGTFVARATMDAMDAHPGLDVVVHHLEPRDAVAELLTGHLELAVVDDLDPSLRTSDERVVWEFLLDDPLMVVLPEGHPDARRRTVALESLAGERWLVEREGSRFFELVLERCAKAGFRPRIGAYSQEAAVITALTAARCGVSVLPELAVRSLPEGTVARPVRPRAARRVYVATTRPKQRHPAVRAMIERLSRRAG